MSQHPPISPAGKKLKRATTELLRDIFSAFGTPAAEAPQFPVRSVAFVFIFHRLKRSSNCTIDSLILSHVALGSIRNVL